MSSGTFSLSLFMVCHTSIDAQETNRVCVIGEAELSFVMKLNPTTNIQIQEGIASQHGNVPFLLLT